MSTWEQTLAFGFLPDVDRREAPPPDFAWCPRNINISLKAGSNDALSLATACICAVYSKCEGDDAVLVVDGQPPSAVLNPFSSMKDSPFVDIIAAIAESRKKIDPKAVELRKTLSTQLKERADNPTSATGGNALVGTGGILWRSTITSMGELAAVHAFDMVWSVSQPDDSTVSIGILYNRSLFASVTMEDRLELLELIASAYAANESIVLKRDVETLTESMRHRLLCEWQPERVPFHVYSRTLPDVFIESVLERCGDPNEKLAVMEPSTGRTITYADMLARARKLAQFLRAKVPCDKWGVDATCGIHVPRCLDWYVMMLGLHLAGGAYLSLDPDFPADRLLYTLEDSGAVCLLTLRRMMGSLGYQGPTFAIDELWDEIDAIEIDENFIAPSTAESPAYLIYTSGSTGKPKGVCIEHRNAVNFVESERRLFNIDNNHRVIQGFSTSFDASVEEIWLAFASGSTLIVVDKAVMQDVELLGKLVSATKATILSTVPTLLATIDSRQLASLEMVIAGGEACNKEVIRAYATGGKRKFVNSYGPTEATVACMADFSSPDRAVTIGRPQPGYFACIVNERMELVPPGVPGELCMSGPSVARGYVNRPDLTNEKFCPCPYFSVPKPHFQYDELTANDPTFGRLYHTGDLTRWNKDGRVEFLGRIDSQVKLRGFRIEVGEIETNLAAFPGVRTAVVHLVNDNGHQYLCGYMLCEPDLKNNFVEHAFKDFLKDKLPAYMIPSRFTTIDVVPRSPAGKLDRKQLPLPPPVAAAAGADEEEKVAPASVTEKMVHSMWSEMFPGMRIGTTEDFFEIGGHSLLAGKLASKIRQQGFQEFSIRLVYANPTIQQLAAVMDSMPRVTETSGPQGQSQVNVRMPDRMQPSTLRKVCFGLWQIVVFTLAIALQWAYLLTFFFLFYGKQHTEIAEWVPGRGFRYIIFFGSVMQLFFVVTTIILGFIVIPLLKWIILGRVKPGTHSIWSFYYLRWWTARAFTAQAGSFLMFGTYFYNVQLSLFGASLGASATITTFLQDPDLVEIGDDCHIADNTLLVTSQVIDSMLVLKKVVIGNCCTVCARSTIAGGAQLEDEVFIAPLTLIREGTIVPRGERWAGSPGQKVGYVVQLSQMRDVGFDGETLKGDGLSPHASGINEDGELDEELLAGQAFRMPWFIRFLVGILQLAFYVVVLMFTSNVLGILTFGAWVLCDELADRDELWWVSLYVVGAPLVTMFIMLYQHLLIIIFRWIVFPWKPREGMYPCDSLMFHRKILFDMVARVSLLYAHPMYGSIYTQYYLKAMGCKVGKRVECSNLYGWTPGLTTFGDECFVADFVGVNCPEIFRGVLKLSSVTIGNRAFIGNGSVLPPGTVIGDRALLGLTSCPAGLIVGAGKTAIGSPAFEIPRRTSADTVAQDKTFEPTTFLVVRRCIWETFRCVMPATFITFSAILAFVVAAAIFYEDHTVIVDEPGRDKRPIYVSLALLFIWAIPFFNLVFVLLSKWTIVGTHEKEENPLWSSGVWRSEFVVDVTTVVGSSGTINLFRGTLFMPWLFRLLGARIGKNCFIDTLYLTEPDMLTIGDGVCINYNATIQTHLFEDRVMKVDTMGIGNRASIGPFSIILYNTLVGSGSTVGPLTLVMKGETLPKHTHWSGIPAQKCGAPSVLQEESNIQVVVPSVAPDVPAVQNPSAIASGRIASQRSTTQTTPVVSARERQGFTRVADWLAA